MSDQPQPDQSECRKAFDAWRKTQNYTQGQWHIALESWQAAWWWSRYNAGLDKPPCKMSQEEYQKADEQIWANTPNANTELIQELEEWRNTRPKPVIPTSWDEGVDCGFGAALNIVKSHVPAGVEDSWQPIETAPKDGSFIIVVSEKYGEEKDVELVNYRNGKWYTAYAVVCAEADGWKLTQWMPLPKPPAAMRGK